MSTTVFHDMIVEKENAKISPMSFTQEGLWIVDQLDQDTAINILSATVHASKSLITSVLEESLNMLVQRHEALRTTFSMMEGQLVQVIAPSLTIPLVVRDLRELPEVEQKAQVQYLVTKQAQESFVLSQGPLLRCTLLQLSDEQSLLLLTLHRIVCDEWSMGVLVRDLACLYEACSSEQSASLPSLPWQYADFAVWQRQVLTKEILDEHLTYWRQQLAGAPDILQLPTDRPRQAVVSSQGSMYQVVLPSMLTQALQELSRQQAVSLDIILVAAFQTLLYRYTGQEDLLIGAATPARSRAETEAMIGMCENTLVLRTDLSDQPSFVELLGRVREVMAAGQSHEELPFESLVKALHPIRSLSHNPLFQVLLQLPKPQPALPSGWTLEQMVEGMGTSQFDLTLELQEGPQGLISRFTYSTDLFDEATMVRMAGHWQKLLEGIVSDPALSVARLPLLTPQERSQLLVDWNGPHAQYPLDQCLHQLFEGQVERSPGAVAVIFQGERMTYRELNRQANQLAHYLRDCGVGQDTLVALLAERDIPLLIAILAVFKAGGAYLPLDPRNPEARVRLMIEQSRCEMVLTTAAFTDILARALEEVPSDARPRCISFEDFPRATQYEENLPIGSTPRAMAYVIYTSGSTGLPKGAIVEQCGMVNHLYAKIDALELTAADTVAQSATQCFDISVWQFLAALLVGGCVHIFPDDVVRDPALLLQQVEEQQISILEVVPSLLRAMVEIHESEARSPKLQRLRWMIPTGEALPVDVCCSWLKTYPHVPLLNAYGPTECSDDVTHYAIYEAPEETRSSIPIGTAIPNMRLYVLDRHREPLPIGVSGELYVGGIGVGRGYLGNEQRTSEVFVPDPFVPDPEARLYKTGDLARYLPDGNLEFLGRLDFQVKLRGYRIELGEIEAVLSQHPAVRQGVVVAREDVPGDKRLVAYVVPHQDQDVTVDDLKSQVMKQVPMHMVPSAFVLLESMPLTSNGKLDRKALPVPDPSRRGTEDSYVAPVLLVHEQLVHIWEDLLGVRPIGIRDDFFDLGGDSLLAVRLFDRIERVCGKKLPLSTLFAGATIEHVATVLRKETQVDSRVPLVTVQAGGSKRPFFFLHGEWRGGALYTLEVARHLGPEQPVYLLEPYKFDGLAFPPPYEEMAVEYLEVLRSVQPEGPYLLGGYCMGALMAYEMAQQLHAQGQTVDLLLMIDAEAPEQHRWVRRAISDFGNFMRVSKEKQIEWLFCVQHIYRYLRFARYRQSKISELLGTIEQAESGHKPDKELIQGSLRQHGGEQAESGNRPAVPLSLILKGLVPKIETLRQDYLNVYDWSALDYAPALYPGKMTFFWTSEEPWRPVGWQKVIEAKEEDVEVHVLPGNHVTLRTEHLSIFAELVRTCLNKAQNTTMD